MRIGTYGQVRIFKTSLRIFGPKLNFWVGNTDSQCTCVKRLREEVLQNNLNLATYSVQGLMT